MEVKHTITLMNDRYDFDPADAASSPSVTFDRVLYGYLTVAGHLDAVVVLQYHPGGSAYWEYVYAFSLTAGQPKLIGWFRTGSRANFGLYRVKVGNHRLTVDLLDPSARMGDCCSNRFVRTSFKFRGGYFVQSGPQEFGEVDAVLR